jgi:hypothetical protein
LPQPPQLLLSVLKFLQLPEQQYPEEPMVETQLVEQLPQ